MSQLSQDLNLWKLSLPVSLAVLETTFSFDSVKELLAINRSLEFNFYLFSIQVAVLKRLWDICHDIVKKAQQYLTCS